MRANTHALLLLLAALFAYRVNDAVTKLLTANYPVGELLFLRGVNVAFVLTALVYRRHGPIRWQRCLQGWVLARGLAETGVTFTFVSALVLLPLAPVTSLLFVAPALLTLLAGLFLKERIGGIRWAAIGLGFCGVLIIVNPFSTLFHWALMLPLAAALFSAKGCTLLSRQDAVSAAFRIIG